MGKSWDRRRPNASKSAAGSGRDNSETNNCGTILPQAEWFAVMGRELWQFKIGAHLECHLGCSERTARAWGSGTHEPPARALAMLLRTDDGPRILEYLMRDSPPPWWTDLQTGAEMLARFTRRA